MTEFIYNDHRRAVTHLVADAHLIAVDGDTVTVCGLVTAHADPESRACYEYCLTCAGLEASGKLVT